MELWCIDVEERRAWNVMPKVRLNAVCGEPFTWLSDSKSLIVKTVLEGVEVKKKSYVPDGPIIQESNAGESKPHRTYQDLLKVSPPPFPPPKSPPPPPPRSMCSCSSS